MEIVLILYCTVLYCTVLYCTVLYCTVLYCIVLYLFIPEIFSHCIPLAAVPYRKSYVHIGHRRDFAVSFFSLIEPCLITSNFKLLSNASSNYLSYAIRNLFYGVDHLVGISFWIVGHCRESCMLRCRHAYMHHFLGRSTVVPVKTLINIKSINLSVRSTNCQYPCLRRTR